MTLYSVMKFFHFLGLVSLAAGGVAMHGAGTRLRRAATVEEVRVWLGFARAITPLFPVGGLLLLVTGFHLAGTMWTFTVPWIVVGYVTVLALLPMGPIVQRPRFMAMGKAAMAAAPGPVPPELRRLLTNPLAWGLAYAGPCAVLGLLWIMTQKPAGWAGAAIPVLVLVALGLFLGGRAAGRDRALSGVS